MTTCHIKETSLQLQIKLLVCNERWEKDIKMVVSVKLDVASGCGVSCDDAYDKDAKADEDCDFIQTRSVYIR